MTKTQFKNQYSYFRMKEKAARGSSDWYTQELITCLNPLRSSRKGDVLACRMAGFTFARPGNRHGIYGWDSYYSL